MSGDREEWPGWQRGLYGWLEGLYCLIALIIMVIAAGLISGIIIGFITVSALVIVILLSIVANWKGRATRLNPILNIAALIIAIILILEIIHFILFFGIDMFLNWFTFQVWYWQQLGIPPDIATRNLVLLIGVFVAIAIILIIFVILTERRAKTSEN